MSFLNYFSRYFETVSEEKRYTLIRKTACLFLVVGILMSHNLWFTERLFPFIPIHHTIPVFSDTINTIGTVILLLNLTFLIFKNSKTILSICLSILLVFLLQDQLKWQPWLYMYILILLP